MTCLTCLPRMLASTRTAWPWGAAERLLDQSQWGTAILITVMIANLTTVTAWAGGPVEQRAVTARVGPAAEIGPDKAASDLADLLQRWHLTVTNPLDRPRTDVPLRMTVLMTETAKLGGAGYLRITGGNPDAPAAAVVAAQLTELGLAEFGLPLKQAHGTAWRELHVVIPYLGPRESVSLTLAPQPPDSAAPNFAWRGDAATGTIELTYGDRPVMTYVCPTLDESTPATREATYKPFHHVYAPDGTRLITKGAGGKYTHHRGLFFGFNKCAYAGKKADVWHCTGEAHQRHVRVVSSQVGPVLGRHLVEITWHGPGREVFARELRQLTAYAVSGGSLIDFASRVTPAEGIDTVTLDGDPQHAGFHFRADNEVSDKTAKQTYYIRPDGVGKPGAYRNWDPKTRQGPTDLPWNAVSFVLGTQRFTVGYFDRPHNPKQARFSERDYARFGSYFEYEMSELTPLRVSYRVWVQPGEATSETLAARAGDFTDPPEFGRVANAKFGR